MIQKPTLRSRVLYYAVHLRKNKWHVGHRWARSYGFLTNILIEQGGQASSIWFHAALVFSNHSPIHTMSCTGIDLFYLVRRFEYCNGMLKARDPATVHKYQWNSKWTIRTDWYSRSVFFSFYGWRLLALGTGTLRRLSEHFFDCAQNITYNFIVVSVCQKLEYK